MVQQSLNIFLLMSEYEGFMYISKLHVWLSLWWLCCPSLELFHVCLPLLEISYLHLLPFNICWNPIRSALFVYRMSISPGYLLGLSYRRVSNSNMSWTTNRASLMGTVVNRLTKSKLPIQVLWAFLVVSIRQISLLVDWSYFWGICLEKVTGYND